jgi:hypothetical protein
MRDYFIQIEYSTSKGKALRFSYIRAESENEAREIVTIDIEKKNILHCGIFDKKEYITTIYH